MSDYQDRKHPRVTAKVTVDVDTDELLLYNRIDNISLGGACIRTVDAEPVGKQVELAINLPDDQEIVTNAEVVWSQDGPQALIGVRFLDMDEANMEKLAVFLYPQGSED